MKKLTQLLAMLPLASFAQIGFQPTEIQFNPTQFGEVDSIEVTIENNYATAIDIEGVEFHQIYGNSIFFVNETFPVSVAANGSAQMWVYFEPEHNIVYNSEMVVQTNYRGSYSVNVVGDGKFSSYYSSTFDKSEEDLKSALKSRLTSGYNSLSYNNARDNMYATIDNTGGDVECVYTGRVATFNTRPGANSNNFNCEHTFPQGMFSQNLPMKSDIHHLFPTDVTANSQRGNLKFGVVSGNGSWSQGGSKKGGSSFEPRDVQKGATARAMMYFVTRYQDYSNFFAGQQAILRTWHEDYAPQAAEIQRNQAIFNVQNNRNPYVDYPQFIERIQDLVGNSEAPENYDLWISETSVDFGAAVNDLEHTIVLFNKGNQPVEVSNFAFSNSSFFFSTTVGTETIAPGEALELVITTDAGLPFGSQETLTFDTDIPSGTEQTIDLLGGWFPVSVKENVSEGLKVYPNPAQTTLQFNADNKRVPSVIRSIDGKKVKECFSPCAIEELVNGVYLLEINSGEKAVFIKK